MGLQSERRILAKRLSFPWLDGGFVGWFVRGMKRRWFLEASQHGDGGEDEGVSSCNGEPEAVRYQKGHKELMGVLSIAVP
jgi:hypothetical protein